MNDSTTLAKRFSVDELVRAYQESVADIRASFAKIHAAERRLSDLFGDGDHDIWLQGRYTGRGFSFDNPDDVLWKLRIRVWRCIVERLELRRMMSVRAWEELQGQIDKGDMPEITETTVRDVVNGFASQLDTMLRDAVQEVYGFLRPPRGWDHYKTNEKNAKFELGEKVILEWMVERKWGGRDGYQPRYDRAESKLTALENVFSALDGKGSVTKGHFSELSQAIKASGKSGRGETRYFAFKCFKNGNLHLSFQRMDLVKRLNEIAGGKALRESEAA